MHNTMAGGIPTPSDDRDQMHRAIVAGLASVIEHVRKSLGLIEHIQASLTMIEAAVASEASAAVLELAANVVVLDDVTPRYLKAGAALRACDAGLGVALHFLREPMASESGMHDSAGSHRLPAHGSAVSSQSLIN